MRVNAKKDARFLRARTFGIARQEARFVRRREEHNGRLEAMSEEEAERLHAAADEALSALVAELGIPVLAAVMANCVALTVNQGGADLMRRALQRLERLTNDLEAEYKRGLN